MKQKQDFFTVMGGAVKFMRGAYNVTSDAVWLAAAVDTNKKQNPTVLDVGIGTGGVAMCLMARMPNAAITGIDISDTMISECIKNAELNNRELELGRVDILKWKTNRTFDIVITNPPYFKGIPRQSNGDAHHNVDLTAWTRACLRRVKPRGYFYCIVDGAAGAEIIAALRSGMVGDISIVPLFGGGKYAERVIISGRLGTRGGTKIYPGHPMNEPKILRKINGLQDMTPTTFDTGAPRC